MWICGSLNIGCKTIGMSTNTLIENIYFYTHALLIRSFVISSSINLCLPYSYKILIFKFFFFSYDYWLFRVRVCVCVVPKGVCLSPLVCCLCFNRVLCGDNCRQVHSYDTVIAFHTGGFIMSITAFFYCNDMGFLYY